MQRVWSSYLDPSAVKRTIDTTSPRTSIAASDISNAESTRHILDNTPSLNPYSGRSMPTTGQNSTTGLSLTINYVPSKFSGTIFRRKTTAKMPKPGGGVEAFRSGESRMPGQTFGNENRISMFGGKLQVANKYRWNKFKWVLFFSNLCLTTYALVSLVACLLTWFDVWQHADVMRVGNRPELIVSTIGATIGVLTSIIGWAGILLNNRSFLAVYTFMTWITFAFLITPGYITFRRSEYNLEGKINSQWSRTLGAEGRLRIQNQLECCGYFSPFVEATVSQTCYARSLLPGCKLRYLTFERNIMRKWYHASLGLAPLHILVMIAVLLCSNHVTYRFGKGMMPEAYRLDLNSMAVIMENYANQLAEEYGAEAASEILKRSRSNLNLSEIPSNPFENPPPTPNLDDSKYQSATKKGREPF